MNKNDIASLFIEKGINNVHIDELMKNHTSFKIGGPADVFIAPENEQQLIDVIKICRQNDIDFYIMGNGTNLLVRDGGMRGVVIKIGEGLDKIEVKDNRIYAEAGALLTSVSNVALKHSLTGMEFGHGIPGSVGGAITMNAGAYGGEIRDIVAKVRAIDSNNEIVEISNEDMNFRYRGSKIVDENLIGLSVELDLKMGNYDDIVAYMKELTVKRTTKQPLELPSAGSTFKRPEGFFAGKLIEDAGLRGLRYNGAQVSQKHCGFVVNSDNATANDVLTLISVVQKTVRDKNNVELEPEIKIIGED